MNIRRSLLISMLWASLTYSSIAQSTAIIASDTANYPYWIEMMADPGENFYHVQKAFNIYFENKDMTKIKGWKPFKRWEYRMLEGRIYPDGTRRPEDHVVKAYDNYLSTHKGARSLAGNWTNLGPFVIPDSKGYKGLGRLNAIAFDPVDPDVIWVGSPSGGLWKTTSGGNDWTSSTQDLPSLGVSAILIDYSNPSVMYIGTGDRDAGDAAGLGVYRSTDGGETWEEWNSGMNNKVVGRLLMHPTNHLVIFAATNDGLYRTTTGGGTWTQVCSGDFKDVVFKPNAPDIVYAAGNGNFYRSVNGGLTFTQVTSGMPGGYRAAISVTPDRPAYVYVILTNGDSFKGLYRSIDSGQNFTVQSTTPNIMSWGCAGGDGGQAWYDLDIASDPTDYNVIFAGGVNCFKSSTGGTTWNISSHWWGDCSVPSVHADLHVLEFNPLNNRLYAGNDGGVYYSPDKGISWIEITNGLPIGQVYKIGQSATIRNKTVNGYQDNGSSTYMGSYWQNIMGGDGMECAVDPIDGNYSYGTVYFGYIERQYQNTYNGTVANNGFNGINESGAWITPFILDEKNPDIMFVGYKNVWRSTNVKSPSDQIVWQKISGGLGGADNQDMRALEQSPVNSDILYAARYDNMFFRTDNCKASSPAWYDLTNLLPENAGINDMECDPFNPDIVYISLNNKIYKSIDRGQTWENISGTLPGVAFTSITAYKNSHDGLYISSDIGVFYKDQFMSDWIMFSNGLPPDASVTEIEIYYDAVDPSGDIIRAGTYGRGLWESDVYHSAPLADFQANETLIPPGCAIDFTDLTSGVPTSWLWEFDGANPSTSVDRDPSGITYVTPGTYQVRLVAMNEAGIDTALYTDYIAVSDALLPLVDFTSDTNHILQGTDVQFTDLTTGNPAITWTWALPGATIDTSYEQNPIVTYSDYGIFDVTLTVVNAYGSGTEIKTGYMTVDQVLTPEADFLASQLEITEGEMIDFTDLSLNTPIAWTWAFEGGEPTTSSEQNPDSVVYSVPGVYNVSLTASNNGGSDTELKESYITVSAGLPPASDFYADVTEIAVGDTVNFFDLSANNPNQWIWTFEGATPETSAQQNPVNIVYPTEGLFNVQLRTENTFGNNTMLKENYIDVGNISVKDMRQNPGLVIYPNPSSGEVKVRLQGGWEAGKQGSGVEVDIINSFGIVFKTLNHDPSTGDLTIDLSDQPDGLYIIRIISGDQSVQKKLSLFK